MLISNSRSLRSDMSRINNEGIIELIKARQSCRSYSAKKVELDKLELILEAGRLSPSARNSQPWTLTLAFSDIAAAEVGQCTRANGKNAFTEKCSAFVIITEEANETAFGGIPHRYFAEMDIGMCVMNMCLAAESIGVASCILGSFDEDAVKRAAGISEEKSVKLIIALGYAEEGYEIREKNRRAFDDCIKII